MPRAAKSLARQKGKTTFKKHKFHPTSISLGSLGATSSRYNRYSDLSCNEDMDDSPESNINTSDIPYKPPPIVTDNSVSLPEIKHLLGSDCVYKRTSIGVKIFPQNKDKYNFCINSLNTAKIEFHTFNAKEDKLYSTFIYGLPRISTDDIIKELRTYNLSPVSVVEVNTRYSSENDAIYKVQFLRRSFTPSSLKSVKTISNVIISWKKQKPRDNYKPTQCWNCLMFGHGGQHCKRKPACMTCANTHLTKDCPFTQNNKRPAVFSCFNCRKNGYERTDHSANDVNCPMRSHYLEVRAKATSPKSTRNVVSRHRTNNNNNSVPASTPSSRNLTNRSMYNQNGNITYAGVTRNENNNLFNIDELFNIFTSALEELSTCTTKIQQIHVVMSLLKYAHDIR